MQWVLNADGQWRVHYQINLLGKLLIRECNPTFEWHKLIWHKDTICKCAFIQVRVLLWLLMLTRSERIELSIVIYLREYRECH